MSHSKKKQLKRLKMAVYDSINETYLCVIFFPNFAESLLKYQDQQGVKYQVVLLTVKMNTNILANTLYFSGHFIL